MTLSQEFRESKINIWQVMKDKFPILSSDLSSCGLGTVFICAVPASEAMEKVMNWFFTLCFVGLGLQTKLGRYEKGRAQGHSYRLCRRTHEGGGLPCPDLHPGEDGPG